MNRRSGRGLPIEKAKNVPILSVAEKLGLGPPVPRGQEWAVLCPLHDDHHPSCFLNTEKNVWHCFACNLGGSGIDLVMGAMRVEFREAVLAMAQWHGPRA